MIAITGVAVAVGSAFPVSAAACPGSLRVSSASGRSARRSIRFRKMAVLSAGGRPHEKNLGRAYSRADLVSLLRVCAGAGLPQPAGEDPGGLPAGRHHRRDGAAHRAGARGADRQAVPGGKPARRQRLHRRGRGRQVGARRPHADHGAEHLWHRERALRQPALHRQRARARRPDRQHAVRVRRASLDSGGELRRAHPPAEGEPGQSTSSPPPAPAPRSTSAASW